MQAALSIFLAWYSLKTDQINPASSLATAVMLISFSVVRGFY